MYLEITASSIRNGEVPTFFAEEWQKREKGRRRYVTEYDYEPMMDFAHEKDLHLGSKMFIGFACFSGGIVAVLACFMRLWQTPDALHDMTKTVLVVSSLVGFLGWIFFAGAKKATPEEERNGHRFFRTLSRLYLRFEIPQNKLVGQLSREAFRGLIEDDLKSRAAEVDSKSGFEKVAARDCFNSMHAIALELELCHEDHGHYFPKLAAKTPPVPTGGAK